MRIIHIINPAAGKGRASSYQPKDGQELYHSTQAGDVERFLTETLRTSEDTVHFIIHGGDGTVNEAINGVMRSGAAHRARLSIVPQGSGNDFARTLSLCSKGEFSADVIRCRANGTDYYAVNIVNIGFDCDTVVRTNYYKKLPLISGSFAYILGLIDVLCRPFGQKIRVIMESTAGHTEQEGSCTLAAIANGQFYGGGFRAASLADITDGLLDVMFIRRVTRRKFISLVSDYKKGTHMDPATGLPGERFREVVDYHRCTSVRIEGIKRFCADGEIIDADVLEAEVLPGAITFINE